MKDFDRPLTVEEIANQKLAEQQLQIDELTLQLGDALLGGACCEFWTRYVLLKEQQGKTEVLHCSR